MSKITRPELPQPFLTFATETARFANATKLMPFSDDSEIGLSTAADKLATVVKSLNSRLGASVKPSDANISDLGERVAPAIETLETLVDVFCQDAESGATSLPDLDDMAVFMGFLGQSEDSLFRVLELTPAALQVRPTQERAELIECLASFGIPRADVGLHPPVMIKIIIILVTVVVFLRRRDTEFLVITIVNVLILIDRRGQGGLKLPGTGGTSQPGTPPTGPVTTPVTPPPAPLVPPVPPVDPCAALGVRDFIIGGSGTTEQAALNNAIANAMLEAQRRCSPNCRARILGITSERATLIGDAANPFRTARRFLFRCEKP
ncbi:hypothetical protein [Ruegeria hyattellae]|uniref:hypothetical protein n=1 Tax=Ruegeria hyattellae TaxID=3233337 RepID=UPI00355BD30B